MRIIKFSKISYWNVNVFLPVFYLIRLILSQLVEPTKLLVHGTCSKIFSQLSRSQFWDGAEVVLSRCTHISHVQRLTKLTLLRLIIVLHWRVRLASSSSLLAYLRLMLAHRTKVSQLYDADRISLDDIKTRSTHNIPKYAENCEREKKFLLLIFFSLHFR